MLMDPDRLLEIWQPNQSYVSLNLLGFLFFCWVLPVLFNYI